MQCHTCIAQGLARLESKKKPWGIVGKGVTLLCAVVRTSSNSAWRFGEQLRDCTAVVSSVVGWQVRVCKCQGHELLMMWLINGPRHTLKTNVSTARFILYSTFHCVIGGINNRVMPRNGGFHAVDSGFPVLDSGFQNRGFWIPHVSIWWIPGFHKQTFPGFQSPDSLKWGVSPSPSVFVPRDQRSLVSSRQHAQ